VLVGLCLRAIVLSNEKSAFRPSVSHREDPKLTGRSVHEPGAQGSGGVADGGRVAGREDGRAGEMGEGANGGGGGGAGADEAQYSIAQ
jgi:hypothetical protein